VIDRCETCWRIERATVEFDDILAEYDGGRIAYYQQTQNVEMDVTRRCQTQRTRYVIYDQGVISEEHHNAESLELGSIQT